MVFIARQEPFACENCSHDVETLETGSYRNHCPKCLFSKHVDDEGPGDRKSSCKSLMKPIGLDFASSKGWIIIHQCCSCSKTIKNIAADDDDLTILSKETVFKEQ